MFVQIPNQNAGIEGDSTGRLLTVTNGMIGSVLQQGLSLTRLPRESFTDDPFTVFDDWLDSIQLDAALTLLRHREVLKERRNVYTFPVEAVRQWFAKQPSPATYPEAPPTAAPP